MPLSMPPAAEITARLKAADANLVANTTALEPQLEAANDDHIDSAGNSGWDRLV
jgi:hypothetical protein